MIEVSNLNKVYRDKTIVKDASWTAQNGEVTGLIGHNGSGKSTTLKMMTGEVKPTSGSIKINGIDIEKNPLEAKEQFGFVSDSTDNFLALTGVEYLNFIADIFGLPSEKRVSFVKDVASRFRMYDSLNNPILSYSHGMRQKIMILGSLIHEPDVWIMDEPLEGLDPHSAFELKKMMKEHASQGKTVVFTTQALEVADKLCDKVVLMNRGVILYEGKLEELREKYTRFEKDISLEEIFFKVIENALGGIR